LTARRDPERRRAQIVEAATAAIVADGLHSVSHRTIAQRAGVPLGSTTYYFPTLDDLRAEALQAAGEVWVRELHELWAATAGAAFPDRVVALTAAYLADRPRAMAEFELYAGAARDPRLRAAAALWLAALEELLVTDLGPQRARAAAMLLDGAILRSLVLDEPLDTAALHAGLSQLQP
jgi:TetR/AcrR family transcriptional regulator, regulator of biofilm formation and stress response